jgi:heme oxygenase
MPIPQAPLHQALRHHTSAAHARLDAGLGEGLRTEADYSAYASGMGEFLASAAGVLGPSHALLARARAALAHAGGAAREAEADLATRLGWEYVVTGATLGARVLLRQARERGFGQHLAGRFLAAFADGDDWPRFLRRLEAVQLDPDGRSRACDAALAAFHSAESALSHARSAA